MDLWLAINQDFKMLSHTKAKTEDEAYWKFQQMGIYPYKVIECAGLYDWNDIENDRDYHEY